MRIDLGVFFSEDRGAKQPIKNECEVKRQNAAERSLRILCRGDWASLLKLIFLWQVVT